MKSIYLRVSEANERGGQQATLSRLSPFKASFRSGSTASAVSVSVSLASIDAPPAWMLTDVFYLPDHADPTGDDLAGLIPMDQLFQVGQLRGHP